MQLTTHLRTAKWLSHLLDSRFSFLGFHFGLDPVFSLIPGIGTVIPTLLSLYLLWIGVQMKLPTHALAWMVFNIAVDSILGSIPVLGVLVDAVFKGNEKNMKILDRYDQSEDTPIRRIVT